MVGLVRFANRCFDWCEVALVWFRRFKKRLWSLRVLGFVLRGFLNCVWDLVFYVVVIEVALACVWRLLCLR